MRWYCRGVALAALFCWVVCWFMAGGLAAGAQTAGVFKATASSGTLYTVLLNAVGQLYNASASGFENEADANWTGTKYCVAMTRQGTSQIYLGSMPAGIGAGRYSYITFAQAGGSPAVTDTIVAQGAFDWTGAALASVAGNLTIGGYASGQDPATLILGATAATWNTTGTIGNKINTGGSGSGSDPFANLFLPNSGAYAANTWGGHLTAFLGAAPAGWLASDTGSINAIVNGVFAHNIEATVTLQQALEIIAAYCGGNVNTGAHTYSGIGAPATVRMTYIIDAFGNRNFTLTP